MIDASARDIFRRILIANELGLNMALVYRFSDADGIRTGKSGYTFGVTQLDLANNPSATLCLRECGFTGDEILALKAQTCRIEPMDAKLAAAAAIVDAWDAKQLEDCLLHPLRICRESNIALGSDETLYHLADYHNQFYMSRGGKMHRMISRLGYPVMPEDIRNVKLKLPWGHKRPDDVWRRYKNILHIIGKGKVLTMPQNAASGQN